MTHVAREEFAIDLGKNHDINDVEEEKKKEIMVAIKRDPANAKVEKSQSQGTSSNEETGNPMKTKRQLHKKAEND